MKEPEDITRDSLFDGGLICHQNRKGYRFSMDSVLLAHFCLHWKNGNILDIGCGCGILGLLLLYRTNNVLRIDGIELQESLVRLAKKNSAVNNFSDKLHIIHGDYRKIDKFFPAENFSNIICNPPFYKIGSGRRSNNKEAYIARHQGTSSTVEIVNCMAYALKNKGRVSIIYPADSFIELVGCFVEKNIQPKRMRLIYSYPESKTAGLVLFECVKNGGEGLQMLSPLYIYKEKNGEYTQEVGEMYRP